MIKLFFNHVKTLLKGFRPYRDLRTLITERREDVTVRGVERGFLPLLLAALYEDSVPGGLVIVPEEGEAEELHADVSLFLGERVLRFPAWQTVPYSEISSQESVFQERAKTLSLLLSEENRIVITSVRGALSLLPPRRYFERTVLRVRPGLPLDSREFAGRLSVMGYSRVPRVSLPSEFAVRGEVIDVFVPQDGKPARLLLEFDTVESIREFDPVTQLSESPLRDLCISPVREFVVSPTAASEFERHAREAGFAPGEAAALLERIENDPEGVGREYAIPLLFPDQSTLLDYLRPRAPLFLVDEERLTARSETLEREYAHRYGLLAKANKAGFPPDKLIADWREGYASHEPAVRFPMHRGETDAASGRTVSMGCDPPRSFFGNIEYFTEEIDTLLEAGYRIGLFADYEAQALRLRHILGDREVDVFPLPMTAGFSLPALSLLVIVESEVFRRKKRVARALRRVTSERIDSFIDLEEGDFIVHIQHGIGRYLGIERVRSSSFERDYIKLEYADAEILFLPTEQVNLIERYVVPGGKGPRLDKIGGKSWSARKEKVRRSVEELAAHLLSLYSARKQTPGFAFQPDTEWQEKFEAGFPYEETPDQLTCIADVKRDMETPNPMDRLICGDVGYGKTEVALRAAFKAVMGGKQVAVLAPTTILAEQHFETFSERMEHFPVQIRMLSRFITKQEQKRTLKELETHQADIVIGTHRLVQKDVRFKNLGLLVVDEEQRFGVRHKERLKELKASVDCLVLSATPIPRTLYMSLMKIRDMSLLNTPPRNRLPIETFVEEWNRDVIERAVRREIERGGQVFFLHNRIESIHAVYSLLSGLFPELRIAAAHGRMEGDELEDIMHGFIRGNYHVLVSTAIIENGIDIPNVNTIIIDRADMFGISQLYQLRGRVGRSDVPAYAYLLYPERRALNERAMKRLQIISDFTELGSGFKIALKDLEIRGAGNLLGPEQHGDILAVGFDMYMKLLEEAMNRGEPDETVYRGNEVFIELEYSGFIPDSYIAEPMEKMETYKQIAAVTSQEELEAAQARIEDRFGPLPVELASLLSVAELRVLCNRLAVRSLKEQGDVVRIEFTKVSHISVDKVLRLIKESGQAVFLKNASPECVFIRTGKIGLKEKTLFLREKLAFLL